jgi:biofilm protein TabA
VIVSNLTYINRQVLITPAIKQGLDFLRRSDLESLQDGKIIISGERVFALIQRYETKPFSDELRFEYHRKFMDIQYVVSGEEVIGWAPAERMTITEPYSDEKDICFGRVSRKEITQVYLKEDQMVLLFPEDGHAPGLASGVPSQVMKIVVKVAL